MWQVQERATLESVDYTLKMHLDGKADLFFHLDFGIREMRRKSIFEKHTHISYLSFMYFKITLRNMYLLEHFVL